MSLKNTIDQDIKTAMRAKDQAKLRTLRAVKAAILLMETAEGRKGEALTEAEELKLLSKQAKQRKDSAQQYRDADRSELAQTEEEELAIIEAYLPAKMSPEDIQKAVKAIVEQTGASSMKDMGKVMGMASKQLAGQADGKDIAQVVKQLLS